MGAAMDLRHKYLSKDKDRHGNDRYYVRKPGRPKVRIKGEPGSPEFMAAYHAALEAPTEKPASVDKGSFRTLCIAYFSSPIFAKLDESTRTWRRRELETVCRKHGHKPVERMESKHVRRIRDEVAEMPGAANNRLKAIKALFAWGIEEEIEGVKGNPARDVKLISYKSKGHHSWTIEEVEAFEARHPLGTRAHLAMALLLHTGGRREDAVRLGPQHVRNGRVVFTQAKNEHRTPIEIDIPLHPDLAAVIAATPLRGLKTFLVTDYGKAFSPAGFGNRFRIWCDEAGLPHCSAHGLRKALAVRLAERGASSQEIMAWTGHVTLEEAERYTRAANRRRLADSGLKKLQEGAARERNGD